MLTEAYYVRSDFIFQVDDHHDTASESDGDSDSESESELEEDSDTGPGSDSA